MTVLRANNLTFGFDDEAVIEDLTLAAESGDVLAVIGPSGVGKTTLLRLFALYLKPDAGTVSIDGVDPWERDREARLALRRRIGMVFQGATLFDASVARNVEYGLRIRRSWAVRGRDWLGSLAGPTRIPSPVSDALQVVGLADAATDRAADLSGGEAQRVSFARALAFEPDVLLLDEPTSDLDPRNTAVIEGAIAEAKERDIGVIVATHDMHQAERVADRVAVLLGRRLTEVGPTERIFTDPTETRTRQFISGELVYTDE